MSSADRRAEKRRIKAARKEKERKRIDESKSPARIPNARALTQSSKAKYSFLPWIATNTKAFLIWLGIVASIAAGYVLLLPDISIEPYVSLDESLPFSTQFRITNNSLLAIHDVKFYCGIHNLTTRDGSKISKLSVRVHATDDIGDIDSKSSATVNCSIGENSFVSAEIVPWVRYRAALWPWHTTKEARFQALVGSDGKWHWIPRARFTP